ncbi:MAG: PIN domain-containing protein [Chloroflexi bacterium]|uniref:PIN domain-containing protein n=1 Tax=Candidatus Chlorohelix allophototropha TaxID=3003348 RepID=A0A8T7LXI4_9CHLR|nr:PIN domain-containing protein [Chloroflexota bacterium]WJW66804.1 PIN domain-containing protein [Chloroflexota bacterium L227-S17]
MNIRFFFRLLGMVVFGILGWQLGSAISQDLQAPEQRQLIVLLMLAGAAIGATAAPYFTLVPFSYARKWVKMLPAIDLIASSIGLTLGLVVAGLLTFPLAQLPGLLGNILPVTGAIVFGYLGVSIMVMRKREVFEFLGMNRAASSLPKENANASNNFSRSILVDTSAIIDGRIADVSQTGFIEGTLIIPRFVLNELQHIADSSDPQRRNRGQRGLEMLRKLRKDSVVPIEISEIDTPDVNEVDGKLVKIAKTNHFPVITNDYNLNRVAELQGVKVLNVNELAQAVRPVVLPGEELIVRITQEGKEMGQGLSYLDDGTMIVVENGRRYMNQEVTITVTRVLQTVAGRMIFAQVRNSGYE